MNNSIQTEHSITYQRHLTGIDWQAIKDAYRLSDWDTGRTPEQLQRAFEGSFTVCLAICAGQVVGTARAISDGVDSALVVDVWVHPELRGQGVGRAMMQAILKDLAGQYVLLTTQVDGFYEKLGFQKTSAMVVHDGL